ncbi:putative neprosin [Arabidopsis thaliana]
MRRMTGFIVAMMVAAAIFTTCVDGNKFFYHREIKVLRHLKRFNKPALKSIKSEDGDVIDCVPITNQPAFDHPLLKNHTIQMRPSFYPLSDSTYTKREAKAVTQVWHKAGECPKNTVPIRRTKKEDLLRPKSIRSFGRKSHQSIPRTTTFDPTLGHQYALMGVRNGKFYGTEVAINLWKPYVQIPKEFSLAQTWVVSGNGSSLNTIEAGWQVYPELYDDNNPRLFVYWTRDGYRKTGCYNLLCSGFVQTSNRYTVGGSITTMSRYRGTQYDLSVLIWKDQKTGNWWLRVNEKDVIGYWPGSLFNSLGREATRVEWGGEIINWKSGGRHTTTDMGSGHFADEGFKKASYFRNLKIVDGTNTLREPQGLYFFADKHNCYNVKTGNGGTSWGAHFFYGGPGRNVKCP